MTVEMGKKYDVRAGGKTFSNLSAGVIVNNIKNGKLKPEHEIAHAGSENWAKLKDVPQLQQFFVDTGVISAAEVSSQKTRFDIKQGDAISEGHLRSAIIEMIRKGELKEADYVRSGGNEWKMAGDMEELERYFEIRRKKVATQGFRAAPEDTGKPFYLDFAAPFKYFANLAFFANILAVLIAFGIARFVVIPLIAGPIVILTSFYIYAYYFRVVFTASEGGKKFPEFPDIADLFGELVRPSVQFFFSRLFAFLPLLAYISTVRFKGAEFMLQVPYLWSILSAPWNVFVQRFPKFGTINIGEFLGAPEGVEEFLGDFQLTIAQGTQMFTWDIFVWLLFIVALVYFPIAVMRQAAYGQFLPTFNFPAIIISIGRAAPQFFALVVIYALIDLASLGILFGFSALLQLPFVNSLVSEVASSSMHAMMMVPIIFSLIVDGVVMIATFMQMYFIGRFLYQNVVKMGWD